jgi:hypothetical protein
MTDYNALIARLHSIARREHANMVRNGFKGPIENMTVYQAAVALRDVTQRLFDKELRKSRRSRHDQS